MTVCDVLLYHANCFDGFMAYVIGWMASRAYGSKIKVSANFRSKGLYPGETLHTDVTRFFSTLVEEVRNVYIFDISMGPATFRHIKTYTPSVLYFDHHETTLGYWSQEEDDSHVTIDQSRAGCEMAWDFFFRSPYPRAVRHIGNRDTWRNEYVENTIQSQEICEVIYSTYIPSEEYLEKWIHLVQKTDFTEDITLGITLINIRNNRIRNIVKNRVQKTITLRKQKYRVVSVNSTCDQSDIGSYIMSTEKDCDFCAIWYYVGKNKYRVSLRSQGHIDVSKVAAIFGGGGHKEAAAFKTTDILPFQ
jgi:uncharacterized protein